MDRYKVKHKRRWNWTVEQSFFARGNALAHARVMKGWVVDGDGRIVGDFRPGWRRRLAGLGTRARRWWLRQRVRWMARRVRGRLARLRNL